MCLYFALFLLKEKQAKAWTQKTCSCLATKLTLFNARHICFQHLHGIELYTVGACTNTHGSNLYEHRP